MSHASRDTEAQRSGRTGDGIPGPGDFGRRLAARRHELGLGREELAARARMAAGYVEDLEERPAQLTTDTVLRLASALETTPVSLLGGDVDRALGSSGAAPGAKLEAMSQQEARQLLATGGVGRVVFTSPERGPVALPVNYRVHDGDIVFRTGADTSLAAAAGQEPVSFEVDHIDEPIGQGWSVLVTGRLERVNDPRERRRLLKGSAEPWAGRDRTSVLRLEIQAVSGRRIRARW